MGAFTLGWRDIYYFLHCPKILAFKQAGFKAENRSEAVKKPLIQPNIAGTVGERAVGSLLGAVSAGLVMGLFSAGSFIKKASKTLYQEALAMADGRTQLNRAVREELRRLAEETARGVVEVGKYVSDRYGALQVVGKGEIKSLALPSYNLPDLVFKVAGEDRYVLVEVKNVKRLSRENRFQASFYTTLMAIGGLAVRHPLRLDKREPVLEPIHSVGGRLDVLLVVPRQRHVEKIGPLDVDLEEMARSVWEAKILGMQGRQPDVPRGSWCRWCRWKDYCSHYRPAKRAYVGSIDFLPRSPYILFAEAAFELGFSLDVFWLYQYVSSVEATLLAESGWERLLRRLLRRSRTGSLAERLSGLLAVDTDIAHELASMLLDRGRRATVREKVSEHVRREFQEDLEAWSRATGERSEDIVGRFSRMMLSSMPKRIALPRESNNLLERARKIWKL